MKKCNRFCILSIVINILILTPIFAYTIEQDFANALKLSEEKDIIQALEKIVDEDKDSYYGQLSLLELAKIDILRREYKQAISRLKKIHRAEIEEKEFWMANTYLKDSVYSSAIISAQNYIFDSKQKSKIESAYFIIAEAYINQKSFSRALNTLEFLRNSEFIENNIPLLHFKIGYCQEMLGNYDASLNSYKKLKIDFPYHQYSYQAEDRIYQLTKMRVPEVTDKELKEFRTIETDDGSKISTEDPKQYQTTRKYLQVGAFGKKINASNLAAKINKFLSDDHVIFTKKVNDKTLHVLAYGPYNNDTVLKNAKTKLEKNGYKSFAIRR